MPLTWPPRIRAIARWKWLFPPAAAALAGIAVLSIAERRIWNWGDVPGWIAAAATIGLLIGAGATVHFARKAFDAQSEQLRDQQALTHQQAELLKIQSGQLDLQSRQFEEQRKVNERQSEVLALQARELEASLAQRKEDATRETRAQAGRVNAWFELRAPPGAVGKVWGAVIDNASALPIFDVRVFFNYISQNQDGTWTPIMGAARWKGSRLCRRGVCALCLSPTRSET